MTKIEARGAEADSGDDEGALVVSLVERLLAEHDPASSTPVDFLGARYDAGLAWVWFAPGCGGLGLSPQYQGILETELRHAGAPSVADRNVIGYGMGAPTVATHGTEEQRQRLLRPLFTGEEIWCQLFSEPGAGSDVAGLATSAVRDGNEWIVNGQKVWTSFAHTAKWGMLLARTDPHVSKHRGLTYFVVDMHSPGVDVRPLRQITGRAEFNEVFFDNTRIPDSMRLDAVGAGWRVAMTTLMNERVAIGGAVSARDSGPIQLALKLWQQRGKTTVERDRLARLWIDAEVARLTNLRAREMRRDGTPGPEGSVSKLVGAELNQRIYELCVDLMGMDGTLFPSGYETRPPVATDTYGGGDATVALLRSRANSIEGGTSEIMRNILGERVLGLPGEPRVDKDVAWIDVARGS
jgi:alkylation response protein AidB-like acyl-CoA dehydrogenase